MTLFKMRDSWNVWRRKVDAALGGMVEPVKSVDVTYDNTNSGLTATNVQSAIDEVAAKECTLTSYSTTIENAVSVPNSTGTAITSLSLPAGTYLLIGYARFVNNDVGVRVINIDTIEGRANTVNTTDKLNGDSFASLNTWVLETYNNTTTVYLNAIQSSGAALNVNSARLSAIKIA